MQEKTKQNKTRHLMKVLRKYHSDIRFSAQSSIKVLIESVSFVCRCDLSTHTLCFSNHFENMQANPKTNSFIRLLFNTSFVEGSISLTFLSALRPWIVFFRWWALLKIRRLTTLKNPPTNKVPPKKNFNLEKIFHLQNIYIWKTLSTEKS